jgi:hypothetical protein
MIKMAVKGTFLEKKQKILEYEEQNFLYVEQIFVYKEHFLITWDKNSRTGVNFAVQAKKSHVKGTNFF